MAGSFEPGLPDGPEPALPEEPEPAPAFDEPEPEPPEGLPAGGSLARLRRAARGAGAGRRFGGGTRRRFGFAFGRFAGGRAGPPRGRARRGRGRARAEQQLEVAPERR